MRTAPDSPFHRRDRWRTGPDVWAVVAGGSTVAFLIGFASVLVFLVAGIRSGRIDWSTLLSSELWDPSRGSFGASAMIWGTVAVAVLALVVAVPLGWAAAVAITELVPARWRERLRIVTQLLAVVPSIVYGLLGVIYLRPFVAWAAKVPGGDSLLAAGLVLGVMVLPTIIAVSVDALSAVPQGFREAARACGLETRELVGSAVWPHARAGMLAAVVLGLARALGETIAIFLVIGRADGRMPSSVDAALAMLPRPGQTLTTKLNGPESVLAGTSGDHWAAMCALGLILLSMVIALTVWGEGRRRFKLARSESWRVGGLLGGTRLRKLSNATFERLCLAALWLIVAVAGAIGMALFGRGVRALDPGFWWHASQGASGGGIRTQLLGTGLVVVTSGLIAAPLGLGLGLLMAEYVGPRLSNFLRTMTLTVAGVPSILLGLWGYWLLTTRLGWGKSWLAGAICLSFVVIPPTAISVLASIRTVPSCRLEAAKAVGLRRMQLTRSVLLPQATPGLITGLCLGLARATGETAPLLFTAAVFSGASAIPRGITDSPITTLPTHIFTLAQDSLEPIAQRTAWGSALALTVLATALFLLAAPARRRLGRLAA